jgi:hypothetical protein
MLMPTLILITLTQIESEHELQINVFLIEV